MNLNIELAEKVLDQITKHPESHNQDLWAQDGARGTTACIAGWALIFSDDARIDWREGGIEGVRQLHVWSEEENDWTAYDDEVAVGAAELLGLDSYNLFWEVDEQHACRRLAYLIELAKEEQR